MKKNVFGKLLAGLAMAALAGIMAMSPAAQANETPGPVEPDSAAACSCPNGFNQCNQGQCMSNSSLCNKCCNNHDPSYCLG